MSKIREELVEFVQSRIVNIDRLRVLLLVYQEKSSKWTLEALSARLYIPISKLEEEIRSLLEQGFIKEEKGVSYSYDPSCVFATNIEALTELDRSKPVTLINLIYHRPGDPLKMFTEAFKIKKKES